LLGFSKTYQLMPFDSQLGGGEKTHTEKIAAEVRGRPCRGGIIRKKEKRRENKQGDRLGGDQ